MKATLKSEKTNFPTFKYEAVDYILGYSATHGVVEVVMVTDLPVRKETEEFVYKKTELLKQCYPQLDLAVGERVVEGDKLAFITIKLSDRHKAEPGSPPVLLRLLCMMD